MSKHLFPLGLVLDNVLNVEEANNVLYLLEDLRFEYDRAKFQGKPLITLAGFKSTALTYLAELRMLNPATVPEDKRVFVHQLGQALAEIVGLCNKRLPKHPLERKSVIPAVRRGR